MNLDKFLRWAFFCAGIVTCIFSLYMFYINDMAKGAASLSLCVGFMCFATRLKPENHEVTDETQADDDLHDMAVLIADLAVSSLQNIGRTIPPGNKEIQELEDKLNKFLDSMPLEHEEREEIAEKFEMLRERTRRNESGRAIMRSARL